MSGDTPHPLAARAPSSASSGTSLQASASANAIAADEAAAAGLEELMRRPLTEADLDRATAELAAPLVEQRGGSQSLLIFRRGEEYFAIAAAEAAKVVEATPVHRVPHRTNGIFRGIANHDGELLLCVHLEAALGLPPTQNVPATEGAMRAQQAGAEADRPKLVVAGSGRDRWAFEVDEVEGAVDIPVQSLRTAPVTVTAARTGCVRALAPFAKGEAVVLDLPLLFALFRGAIG